MAKILIVDDEVGMRELLSEILRDEGHDILLAENASAARAARNAVRPEASSSATSDSSMEGINPSVRATMAPICTGTPNTRAACACNCGRKSPIRGTIQP